MFFFYTTFEDPYGHLVMPGEGEQGPMGAGAAEAFLRGLFRQFGGGSEEDLRRAMEASMQEEQRRKGPPPASPRFVRQLPRITVEPEDLAEAVNRECSVCLEAHPLRSQVTRLPCAHIFHTSCIQTWLRDHNSCPVCRYELPTDDPQYELQRRTKMRHRPPRFARHELDRLSIRQLKALLPEDSQCHPLERKDLVQHLLDQGAVQLLATPPPTPFSVRQLERMSITELKTTLNDNGVYFDARDVLEKDDLVRLFVLSGRLQLVDDDDAVVVETVEVEKRSVSDTRDNKELVLEVNEDYVEEVMKDASSVDPAEMTVLESVGTEAAKEDTESTETPTAEANGRMDFQESSDTAASTDILTEGEEAPVEAEHSPSLDLEPDVAESHATDDDSQSRKRPRSKDGDTDSSHLAGLSIPELRRIGSQLSVDLSSCIERIEMIERLSSHGSSTVSTSSEDDIWDAWTVSELRALGSVVDVDLSHASSREDMSRALSKAGEERPHMLSYLRALAPLAKLTTQQMRNRAREWQINVSDCLERGEILKKLAQHGPRHAM